MEILAQRLNALQSILTELASESGFTLLSPFADRHGFPEAEFIRSMGKVTKSISIAVDPRDDTDWICEFRAGASVPAPIESLDSNSSSVVLVDRPVFKPGASTAQNKSAVGLVFKSAVAAAHTAYITVSKRNFQSAHEVVPAHVRNQTGDAVALKAGREAAAASVLAKAR